MFTRLLLAIDDSPGSDIATAFAAALARHHAGSVHVFHVNEYLVGGRGVTLRTRAEVTELLTGAVTQIHAVGVRATASSVTGTYREVAGRIAETARDRMADAIVLGSERHRRFGRLFSPHVRARTIRLTSLPVITAPSPLDVAGGAVLTVDDLARQLANRPMVPTPSTS
jgi:nucleotide-binding universal stress UspA family protein